MQVEVEKAREEEKRKKRMDKKRQETKDRNTKETGRKSSIYKEEGVEGGEQYSGRNRRYGRVE